MPPEPPVVDPAALATSLLPPAELGPLINSTWSSDLTVSANLYTVIYAALDLALSRLPSSEALPEWRDIPGWEGLYKVSTAGQLLSVERSHTAKNQWGEFTRLVKARVLKPYKRPDGYLSVRLRNRDYGESLLVHRIVAFAFLATPNTNEEVCHINGVKNDNRVVNLRWDTRSNNHKDKVAHGTSAKGARNPRVKLTEAQVLEIRSSELPRRDIAIQFGISTSLVGLIKQRKVWGWL